MVLTCTKYLPNEYDYFSTQISYVYKSWIYNCAKRQLSSYCSVNHVQPCWCAQRGGWTKGLGCSWKLIFEGGIEKKMFSIECWLHDTTWKYFFWGGGRGFEPPTTVLALAKCASVLAWLDFSYWDIHIFTELSSFTIMFF